MRVDVVTYRDSSTSGGEPRCRLWVDNDGRVLKQEASILGAKLAFVRRTAEATEWMLRDGGLLAPATPPVPPTPEPRQPTAP
jgi:hypothetical protein